MDKKKKPGLEIILGMGRKPKPEMNDEEPMRDEDMGDESAHVDAAHGILDAVKSDDAEGLADALKTFYSLCKHEGGDDEY